MIQRRKNRLRTDGGRYRRGDTRWLQRDANEMRRSSGSRERSKIVRGIQYNVWRERGREEGRTRHEHHVTFLDKYFASSEGRNFRIKDSPYNRTHSWKHKVKEHENNRSEQMALRKEEIWYRCTQDGRKRASAKELIHAQDKEGTDEGTGETRQTFAAVEWHFVGKVNEGGEGRNTTAREEEGRKTGGRKKGLRSSRIIVQSPRERRPGKR